VKIKVTSVNGLRVAAGQNEAALGLRLPFDDLDPRAGPAASSSNSRGRRGSGPIRPAEIFSQCGVIERHISEAAQPVNTGGRALAFSAVASH